MLCTHVYAGSVVSYQHRAFALSPYMDQTLAYNMSIAIVDLNVQVSSRPYGLYHALLGEVIFVRLLGLPFGLGLPAFFCHCCSVLWPVRHLSISVFTSWALTLFA